MRYCEEETCHQQFPESDLVPIPSPLGCEDMHAFVFSSKGDFSLGLKNLISGLKPEVSKKLEEFVNLSAKEFAERVDKLFPEKTASLCKGGKLVIFQCCLDKFDGWRYTREVTFGWKTKGDDHLFFIMNQYPPDDSNKESKGIANDIGMTYGGSWNFEDRLTVFDISGFLRYL